CGKRPSAHASECCSTTACPAASVLLPWGSQNRGAAEPLCWAASQPERQSSAERTAPFGQNVWNKSDGSALQAPHEMRSQEDQGADLISHAGLKADNRRVSSTWASEVEDRAPSVLLPSALPLPPASSTPPATFLRSVIGIHIPPGLLAAGGTVA
uniref:Uncharacterized protein n=1 Tax=Cebus imitator TaxID=2715852 RepID=A0A2K5SDK3_CEBIM